MRIVLSTTPLINNTLDQGKSILNIFMNNNSQNSSNAVTPVIINIAIVSLKSTSAILNVQTKA